MGQNGALGLGSPAVVLQLAYACWPSSDRPFNVSKTGLLSGLWGASAAVESRLRQESQQASRGTYAAFFAARSRSS